MQLNKTDNPKGLCLLYAIIFLTVAFSWRFNGVRFAETQIHSGEKVRALKHIDNSSGSRALEHKIGANEPATIWVVNMPKCGTGSLMKSFHLCLECESEIHKLDRFKTGFYKCPGKKKYLFKSHYPNMVTKVKEMRDKEMEEEGTKPNKCIVVTAVRNPIHRIPSIFFEHYKNSFCRGTQSEEEIIKEYEKFLLTSTNTNSVFTTAEMLRAFGAQNILETMELLSEDGYAFLDHPDKDGPWAGCELLFLQLDYDESNSNLDKGLGHAVEGVKMHQDISRIDLCPKAADNYRAVQEYRITDELMEKMSETNPDFRDIFTYYRNHQGKTQQN